MNLATDFSESAQKHPQKAAIFFGEKEISYTDLLARAQSVAAHLKNNLGVKAGDRVAIWLKNCPEFIEAVYGILFADAVVVPMNNFLKPAEAAYILNDGGIDVLITDAELGGHHPELSTLRPSLKMFKAEEFAALPASANHASNRSDKDLAVIIYTSGTTGRPKGAMLSHGNLRANIASCRILLATVEEDAMAVILPLFHTYMMTVGIFLPFTIAAPLCSSNR